MFKHAILLGSLTRNYPISQMPHSYVIAEENKKTGTYNVTVTYNLSRDHGGLLRNRREDYGKYIRHYLSQMYPHQTTNRGIPSH